MSSVVSSIRFCVCVRTSMPAHTQTSSVNKALSGFETYNSQPQTKRSSNPVYRSSRH